MKKTQIEKSHSVWSNTKLTVLCILASVVTSLLFAFLALKDKISNDPFVISAVAVLALADMVFMFLFSKFKR